MHLVQDRDHRRADVNTLQPAGSIKGEEKKSLSLLGIESRSFSP
jgi:hypothetical protein